MVGKVDETYCLAGGWQALEYVLCCFPRVHPVEARAFPPRQNPDQLVLGQLPVDARVCRPQVEHIPQLLVLLLREPRGEGDAARRGPAENVILLHLSLLQVEGRQVPDVLEKVLQHVPERHEPVVVAVQQPKHVVADLLPPPRADPPVEGALPRVEHVPHVHHRHPGQL
eukprot:CAMPEP_0173453006 /NCGR_PEP_ID=MMETSP1357-20121228/49821_1 /TAXON_ID=77926 /ORGANISM="Hemiselmis rufescens, Strain PCC563" /LENGTH=168 /DNA_ID=CAMNT_0014419931 /DNA_START=222 /DNA_END=725 /DNA_ORIENTATION=-